MNPYIEKLKQWMANNPPNFGDADPVLGLLYECFDESNPYDNDEIRTDLNEFYQQMNRISLREMDKIICPVCKLCRDHERAGFLAGIKIGMILCKELSV